MGINNQPAQLLTNMNDDELSTHRIRMAQSRQATVIQAQDRGPQSPTVAVAAAAVAVGRRATLPIRVATAAAAQAEAMGRIIMKLKKTVIKVQNARTKLKNQTHTSRSGAKTTRLPSARAKRNENAKDFL